MIIQRNRKANGWYYCHENDYYCKFFVNNDNTAIIYEINIDNDFLEKIKDVFILFSVKQLILPYMTSDSKRVLPIEDLIKLGFKWKNSNSDSNKLIHFYTYDIELPDILKDLRVISELCTRNEIIKSTPIGYRLMSYNDYLAIKDQYSYSYKENTMVFLNKNKKNEIEISNLGYQYTQYSRPIYITTLICAVTPMNNSEKIVGFGSMEDYIGYILDTHHVSAIYIKNNINITIVDGEHNQIIPGEQVADKKLYN